MIRSGRRARRVVRRGRVGALPWVGALAVHAALALLLQLSGGPARSTLQPRPEVAAVRVQAADESLLRQRREAHRQAVREAELAERREREARRRAAEAAAEQERAAAQRAEAARRAEAKAAARAEAERRAAEEARKLRQVEERVRARQAEARQRRQREAALLARQAEVWRIAIKERIERVWLQPPASRYAPCEVVVEQNGQGEVLSAAVRGCRASKAWQDSLRKAVLKASPLPRPPRPELFDPQLVITFHPQRSD